MRNLALLVVSILAAAATDPRLALADQGHTHHGGVREHSPAGAPGKPSQVTKVFRVRMLDSMRFEPSAFEVRAGQTVKFVVTNNGRMRHEFGIGTHDEQSAHAEMMLADPDMQHEDGSVIAVEPGRTGELVWRFGRAGELEAGCQVPGHYPAGMKAAIVVRAQRDSAADR